MPAEIPSFVAAIPTLGVRIEHPSLRSAASPTLQEAGRFMISHKQVAARPRNGVLLRRTKRKGRESNPQGCSLARVPGGSRHRSGSPSVPWTRRGDANEWSRVDSNHRSSPRQRDVLAAGRRDRFAPHCDDTPARIRTRNTSLEARDDRPFHHRGIETRSSLTDSRRSIRETRGPRMPRPGLEPGTPR